MRSLGINDLIEVPTVFVMQNYSEKKEAVLNQYFRQYITHITPEFSLFNSLVPSQQDGILNVVHTMFLCSVIDHFGKIMRVGNEAADTALQPGNNAINFKFFVEQFFPVEEKCKGDILYKLFRNGVMHQFFPKASGVFWSNTPEHAENLLDKENGHPRLNNFAFSNCIEKGLKRIVEDLENDTLATYIENIYAFLILRNYGFDDHEELRRLEDTYASRGKSFYDPCQQ